MTRAHDALGFSFELSESAPPVRSEECTPVGELDLDLADFGPALAPSPLAPSPFSPLLPETLSVSQALPTSQAEPTGDDEPMLDFRPRAPVAPKPATVERPAAPPETHAVSAAPNAVSAAPRSPATPVNPATRVNPAAPVNPTAPVNAVSPQVKKIKFPTGRATQAHTKNATPTTAGPQAAAASQPTAASQAAAASPPAAASRLSRPTRFSASISRKAPEAALVDHDSDPDAFATGPRAETTQSIPEDLPSHGWSDAPEAKKDLTTSASWGNETPTAQEIWQNARRVWHSTSRQAMALSGQGLRSAQKFARNVNHQLHHRLEEAAEQRKANWEAEHSQATSADLGDAAAPSDSIPPRVFSAAPAAVPRDPLVSAAVLLAARATLKRAAAPLSALVAAGAVYWAGSQLLGAHETIALSKTASQGPSVPDLGSLPRSQERKSGQTEVTRGAAQSGATQSGAPQPGAAPEAPALPTMQTEQTKMPEGMSWPGKGLIEVVTSEDELIYIDGVFTGRGPLRRIPVTPGKHNVAIKTGGQERTGMVTVEADQNTRAIFKAHGAP